ncbi:MAG TPA: DUF4192 domain-containing protein [Mycolicibacillus parakoreensis]|nr:DUF4192 domain-containing protein [Mycolicibacillus parakoreensis]
MANNEADFVLDRPGALIAALPAVLGFVPAKSLLLAVIEAGALGPVLRVDLADGLADRIDELVEVAAVGGPEAVIAVIVDAAGARCPQCNRDHQQLCAELGAALQRRAIALWAAHVVDRIAAGGRWHCIDRCGAGGAVDDPATSPLAVAAVVAGRRLYRCRADLQAVVGVGDPGRRERIADLLREPPPPTRRSSRAARRRADLAAMLAAAGRHAGGAALDDAELVAMARALLDIDVRDTLYALAAGESADAAESLWILLAQTLPGPSRAEALVLLAFSAYVRGDGALAGVALEAALREQPAHRMAGMLDTALQSGLRPESIRGLAMTGYRLAARLGVTLPPPRPLDRPA